MKRCVVPSMSLLIAGALFAQSAKDEVRSAAKKLAEKGNYSWRSTSENAGGGSAQGKGGQFRPGPTDGKTDGTYIVLTRQIGDQTSETVIKGEKVAIKTPDGWRLTSELGQGGGGQGKGKGFGGFGFRGFQNNRAPAAEVEDLVSKSKEITKGTDAYSGELTEEGARGVISFGGGRRPGGGGNQAQAPQIRDPKATVQYWIKDGVLAKYSVKGSGTITFNNNDINIDRTTTVEMKDVGTTKVTVPDEARQKLG